MSETEIRHSKPAQSLLIQLAAFVAVVGAGACCWLSRDTAQGLLFPAAVYIRAHRLALLCDFVSSSLMVATGQVPTGHRADSGGPAAVDFHRLPIPAPAGDLRHEDARAGVRRADPFHPQEISRKGQPLQGTNRISYYLFALHQLRRLAVAVTM
eukprot:scaffold397194_cov32-Prasinocladus_malaysianus.AAC.1